MTSGLQAILAAMVDRLDWLSRGRAEPGHLVTVRAMREMVRRLDPNTPAQPEPTVLGVGDGDWPQPQLWRDAGE